VGPLRRDPTVEQLTRFHLSPADLAHSLASYSTGGPLSSGANLVPLLAGLRLIEVTTQAVMLYTGGRPRH